MSSSGKVRHRIDIERRVLLIEIERRCSDAHCNTRARIGLTKDEARVYCGFECEQCKRWNEDALNERDVPDWWEELAITDMHTLRQRRMESAEEPGEVVSRMSDDYRRINEGMRGEGSKCGGVS
ncbi:MAG TPA: hypothetical protein VE842_04880 [Pyrinomonadaceae bacterium]|nr:hypothetical protein [Pyrinomonadaceae bacterium]